MRLPKLPAGARARAPDHVERRPSWSRAQVSDCFLGRRRAGATSHRSHLASAAKSGRRFASPSHFFAHRLERTTRPIWWPAKAKSLRTCVGGFPLAHRVCRRSWRVSRRWRAAGMRRPAASSRLFMSKLCLHDSITATAPTRRRPLLQAAAAAAKTKLAPDHRFVSGWRARFPRRKCRRCAGAAPVARSRRRGRKSCARLFVRPTGRQRRDGANLISAIMIVVMTVDRPRAP